MPKKEVNVALIGQKFMGKAHSNAFRKVGMFFDLPVTINMKVLCGRTKDEETAERYGWEETADDWKEVVHRDDIDVVDISTPGHLHAEMAIEAAKAGKHIICEKPLCNTLPEARKMVAAVEKAGVKNMCAYGYRTAPAVALAQEMIRKGKLGRIFHFRAAYQQDFIVDPNFPLVWRLEKDKAGSGALGDIGAHAVDMSRFLCGEIESLSATQETFIEKRPIEDDDTGITRAKSGKKKKSKMGKVTVDDASIFLARFENGALGTFEATRFSTGCKNRFNWEIYGEKGGLRWNLEHMNELWYYNNEDPDGLHGFREILATDGSHPYMHAWWPPAHIIGYEHTFVHEFYNFFSTLNKKKINYPDFRDGMAVQAVLATVEKAAQSKRWETVKQ